MVTGTGRLFTTKNSTSSPCFRSRGGAGNWPLVRIIFRGMPAGAQSSHVSIASKRTVSPVDRTKRSLALAQETKQRTNASKKASLQRKKPISENMQEMGGQTNMHKKLLGLTDQKAFSLLYGQSLILPGSCAGLHVSIPFFRRVHPSFSCPANPDCPRG